MSKPNPKKPTIALRILTAVFAASFSLSYFEFVMYILLASKLATDAIGWGRWFLLMLATFLVSSLGKALTHVEKNDLW